MGTLQILRFWVPVGTVLGSKVVEIPVARYRMPIVPLLLIGLMMLYARVLSAAWNRFGER